MSKILLDRKYYNYIIYHFDNIIILLLLLFTLYMSLHYSLLFIYQYLNEIN